ncbi:MAG: NifU family protein [Niameybacter sp.]
MESKEAEILKVLDKIRPYIQHDGGDVEFVKFEEGIVSVRMLGACAGCLMIDDTLKDGVEAILLEEVPGVVGVRLAEDA